MGYKFNPFTGTLDEVGAGGGGTPGGSDTQIQFNDSSAFGGDADLTWNKTTNVLGITGDVNLSDGGTYTTTLQTITPLLSNKTISLPDATGTVGLVGGSSGNLVVNQSGAYAGVANSSVDNATGNITLGSRFISSLNGAASAPPGAFTGTWFTGGTATTTKPQVLIEPTGATSTAWSTSGTGLGVNAASGFAGNLLDLQVNGTSIARVNSSKIVAGTIDSSGFQLSASNWAGTDGSKWRVGVSSFFTNGQIFSAGGTLSLDINGTFIGVGGTTSSFPALKRSSEILQARLADDSAYTTIDAQHRLQGTAPANATATGTAGDIRYDADYIYICTATNTWKRASIATW
jgi:hypothetical protein